jgi:glutamyl-Q tRNA(Asp) synthetase
MLTRFAPAPTGYLHLGHVVNALYVWGLARARGAAVLLRVEDHDRQRCRGEYETALLDDLDWLGFSPDRFPTSEFRRGACNSRQSERGAQYAAAAAVLQAQGLLYACRCSRQQISKGGVADASGDVRYPGTCRDRDWPLDTNVAWRVRLAPGGEAFNDLICGRQEQDPSVQCGDVMIRDRLGNWTYQFVASVDDHLQGVDLVIRGRDLLASTGRQIRLARLVGRERPAIFAHHPLVMKSPAQKLSKSDGDSGVRDLRARGWTPERVIGEAARLAGLGTGHSLPAREAVGLFPTI